ncbi:hypothetical protein [Tepidanaerobacter syntrophicus]|uniref:hypothetical protein n=1 Tax=Tepidanaerobacter syntrophicus TaxID=224999 RepID=UPI001BD35E4D|nr:hypothetical protein [Tepidanaerobacter syntrophicus]
MDNLKCPYENHGQLEKRPLKRQTYEQMYCGDWYDCTYPGCNYSLLIPSEEILKLYAREAKASE